MPEMSEILRKRGLCKKLASGAEAPWSGGQLEAGLKLCPTFLYGEWVARE